MVTDDARAAALHELTTAIVDHLWTGLGHGRCLYMAGVSTALLRKAGQPAVLQAGSAFWRFTDHDDGVSAQTFGYQWHDKDQHAPLRAQLPEVHVWTALMEPPTIIDLTAGLFLPQGIELAGALWTIPPPPVAIWATDLGTAAQYIPSRTATFYAIRCLAQVLPQELFAALA